MNKYIIWDEEKMEWIANKHGQTSKSRLYACELTFVQVCMLKSVFKATQKDLNSSKYIVMPAGLSYLSSQEWE